MPISIDMMNPENVDMRVKTASIAFFNHSAGNHVLSNSCENGLPGFFAFFPSASFRTIFSFMTQRAHKFFIAMCAFILSFSFFCLSLVITFSTAIFSLIAPARYMLKCGVTNKTICFKLNTCIKRLAFSTTIKSCFNSIISYFKNTFAIFTINRKSAMNSFGYRRFNHAASSWIV